MGVLKEGSIPKNARNIRVTNLTAPGAESKVVPMLVYAVFDDIGYERSIRVDPSDGFVNSIRNALAFHWPGLGVYELLPDLFVTFHVHTPVSLITARFSCDKTRGRTSPEMIDALDSLNADFRTDGLVSFNINDL